MVITISREFGSGGRTIAKAVAKTLGIPYYDKELVKQVAEETGFNEQFIKQEGEYARSGNRLAFALSLGNAQNAVGGMSVNDYLWVMQRKTILDLAEKGSCVIVGRCADYVLKDHPNALHVFIHADMEARAKRIVELYGQAEKSPEKRLEDKDKRRHVFYKHYTGRDWGAVSNFDLSLNSGRIGIDRCVDIIVNTVREMEAAKGE